MNLKDAEKLTGTRWMLKDQSNVSVYPEPGKHPYNGYTVLMITNTTHYHPSHLSQVVYKGDNGRVWSLELSRWPGNLKPEPKSKINYPICGRCNGQMTTTKLTTTCDSCGKVVEHK